jgi:hypothetical protein
MTDDLPPTPEFAATLSGLLSELRHAGTMTETVMVTGEISKAIRAYGQACASAAVARERERCAKACDEHASIEGIAQNCAAAIRVSAMPAPEPGAETGTRHIARSPVSPTDAP